MHMEQLPTRKQPHRSDLANATQIYTSCLGTHLDSHEPNALTCITGTTGHNFIFILPLFAVKSPVTPRAFVSISEPTIQIFGS
jgi:hypothetical protein